ncbi:MAG: diguanylate cyclase [Actinomycetota bacterium]
MAGETTNTTGARYQRGTRLHARLFLSYLFVVIVPLVIGLLVARVPTGRFWTALGVAVGAGLPISALLASEFARPVRALLRLANRIASGDYGAQVEVDAPGEIADLGRALNRLSVAFRDRVTDADAYRDEVRKSVRRLGEALRATHDLTKMLSVVLDTALSAVDGEAGAVYLLSPKRNELFVKSGRRLDEADAKKRIPIGQGLAGWVASTRWPAMVPAGPDAPVLADPEPVAEAALAVPLETESQLVGVLAIYGSRRGRFDQADLETILSLARQAGVGVENVLLHEDAKRMSITDGLTGIWNYRYFQMTLQRDVERAIRARTSQLSLLVIDIDHFKQVNDRFGHQRGDAILIELAKRILENTRNSVDFLARYGGEEFVIILPDTGDDGARAAAEKIRRAVGDIPFGEGSEEPLKVTISIGYAVHPAHALTPQELLRAADQAMYRAKATGRDRVVGADDIGGRRISLARDPAAP